MLILVVIKGNKIVYKLWHDCSTVVMGIILSIMGNFFEHCMLKSIIGKN